MRLQRLFDAIFSGLQVLNRLERRWQRRHQREEAPPAPRRFETPTDTLLVTVAKNIDPPDTFEQDVTEPIGTLKLKLSDQMGGVQLGMIHARALYTQPSLIPESWQEFRMIFPGTVRKNETGYRFYPYLCRVIGEWIIEWTWVDSPLGPQDRVVTLEPTAEPD